MSVYVRLCPSMSVSDSPNLFDQLLPDRHPQADFFICDVADAVLKDLMPTMEHPFYALSKKGNGWKLFPA